jgi:RHS repeat-associated protein
MQYQCKSIICIINKVLVGYTIRAGAIADPYTGNIMAIYRNTNDTLKLIEKPIYGSSRLGIVKQNMTFLNGGTVFKKDTFSVGLKNYELTDHLGNVTVTFLDRKYGNLPYITSSSDYYPFGFPIPDRGKNLAGYRFGFNGQESDNEVYGDKASYAFEFRNYDARLGRWWGIDPLWQKYLSLSPYVYCANNPVMRIDPDGNFAISIHENITHQAMSRSGIVPKTSSFFHKDLVWGATKGADIWGMFKDWHFDGRANYAAVQQRWSSLNKDISTTIRNIGNGNKLLGGSDVKQLGKLIHNVQDFYAHSNYIELYMEYYQGANNGAMPTSVPIYDEGIKNADFNTLLKDNLRTGDFHFTDNEKVDIDPFHEHTNSPTSHNKMNKDNADTPAGKLAKETAIKHTTKILEEIQ